MNIREKISTILLLLSGIVWGNWWITAFLSCPEWWFIAVNALLFGSGILFSRLLKGSWKQVFPAVLLPLVLLIPHTDIRNILMPILFGVWYGGDENISRQWRSSRTFCGGMIIGGVLAGIYPFQDGFIPLFAAVSWLWCGIQFSFFNAAEALLASLLFAWLSSPTPQKAVPERLDPGTVITAFALSGNSEKDLPKVVFIGGSKQDILQTARELDPACWLISLPELPGSVPPRSNLIVVAGLPETGDGGAASLYRSLDPDGVLVMPVNYTTALPELKWYILPGSDGNFAAASPRGELNMDPDDMDDRLAEHFKNANTEGPSAGALAGMLHDFTPQALIPPENSHGKLTFTIIPGIAAILLGANAFRHRRKHRDTGRIIINCAGYAVMAALVIPAVFAGMPTVISLRGLTAIIALMWVFRRPVDKVTPRSDTRFSGMLALLALLAARNGEWIFSTAALIFGGYSFSALDRELCGKRDEDTEAVRMFGFALGAMLAFYLQTAALPAWSFFAAAMILRFWSWFRN